MLVACCSWDLLGVLLGRIVKGGSLSFLEGEITPWTSSPPSPFTVTRYMHSCYKVHLCSDAAFLYLAQSILYHTQASFLQVSFYMIWALLLKLETWPVFDFCPIWCLFFWAFTSSLHPQQAIKTQPPYCSGFLLTQASSSNLPHPIQMTSESVLSILLFFLRSLFYLFFFALPFLLELSCPSLVHLFDFSPFQPLEKKSRWAIHSVHSCYIFNLICFCFIDSCPLLWTIFSE